LRFARLPTPTPRAGRPDRRERPLMAAQPMR
jgi:hypothetical protein